MERSLPTAGAAAGPEFPMEPLGNPLREPERPPDPAQVPGPESPQSSPGPGRAGKEAADSDPAGGKRLPSPRPALLRVPPPSLGYGAFRRQVSAGPEPPPSPGSAAAEPGAELVPWAAPGEQGSWAPMELQVDVRVTPVGAAGGSRAPSPAPSTRFLTVPVPESPAFPRRAAPGFPPRPRTLSSGSTWGRGTPPGGLRAERGPDAEGCPEPPGSPGVRCRCKELGLEKEDSALLSPGDRDKLPRAIKLVGLSMYMRSLQCALAVLAVLLAVSAVAIVALASRAGAQCRPCPQDWVWAREHCYYFSVEEGSWEASQSFCAAHQATLPQLSHTQVGARSLTLSPGTWYHVFSQDFLGRYPLTKDSWLGAQRGPHGWHWMDGTPLQPQLFPEEDEDKPDTSCVGLWGGQLAALDCTSPRRWVCVKGGP
ncbi:killer cell lectin-like receptor subfamily G member 2 [Erinaceus europaeus]|uniref:Killer cell lectin-like receptor subfamily G member 2 n=1 Tax=Erinaceus europaeus TaxID=9365 RepID=A0ABM3XV02_ERIEU|nr:killer cell lectin-like receptor subfamily G member 2 [Erinaceus europaeus]